MRPPLPRRPRRAPPEEAGAAPALPRLLSARRRLLLGRLVADGAGMVGAAMLTALVVESAFDRLVVGGGGTPVGLLLRYGGLLVLAVAVAAWCRADERVTAERLGQSYVHALRTAMFDRLAALSPRALQSRSHGAVTLRFIGDLTSVRQWVSLGLARLIVGATFLLGATAALAFVNLRLAASVGVVLLAGGAAAFSLGGPMRTRSREARRWRARLAGNISERVGAIAVVQVFGQGRRERRRVRRQSQALREAMVHRARIIGRMRGVAEGTAGLAAVVALLVGAHEVSAGRASAGTVVAAMAIVGLLAQPLRDLGRVQEYWEASRISMEKIHSFMATPTLVEELPDAPALQPGPGRLELRDVAVDGALHGITADAAPGSVVAIVGGNGAGKSTLLAVVARLLDPDGGEILLDGQPLRTHSLASVRARIGMVGPDIPLLRGSVDRNLRYRAPRAPEEEVSRVIDLCELEPLLSSLPDGRATRLAEGGAGLSAGQRARLALARAVLDSPSVLLLDEADANLDAEALAVLDRVIAHGRGTCTTLVVTHRRELIARADAVWHLDGGRLVEVGTPAALGAAALERAVGTT